VSFQLLGTFGIDFVGWKGRLSSLPFPAEIAALKQALALARKRIAELERLRVCIGWTALGHWWAVLAHLLGHSGPHRA
jgi:hypothetical protein